MVPFPRTSRLVPYHAVNQRKAVTIYCVCRMPYDKKSLHVECCQCKHWYQPTCVTIPAWAINTNRKGDATSVEACLLQKQIYIHCTASRVKNKKNIY